MTGSVSLLLVTMGGRRCAVDCSQVVEIIPRVNIEPLPRPPPGVLGVVNVRGRVVSIIDIRDRITAGDGALSGMRFAHIIIIRVRDRVVGVVADEVDDVHVVERASVEHPDEFAGGQGGTGVVRIGEELVLVLETTDMLGSADAVS